MSRRGTVERGAGRGKEYSRRDSQKGRRGRRRLGRGEEDKWSDSSHFLKIPDTASSIVFLPSRQ